MILSGGLLSAEARFFGDTKKGHREEATNGVTTFACFLDGKKAVGAETNTAGNLRKSWSFVYQGAVQVQSQSCKPSS